MTRTSLYLSPLPSSLPPFSFVPLSEGFYLWTCVTVSQTPTAQRQHQQGPTCKTHFGCDITVISGGGDTEGRQSASSRGVFSPLFWWTTITAWKYAPFLSFKIKIKKPGVVWRAEASMWACCHDDSQWGLLKRCWCHLWSLSNHLAVNPDMPGHFIFWTAAARSTERKDHSSIRGLKRRQMFDFWFIFKTVLPMNPYYLLERKKSKI